MPLGTPGGAGPGGGLKALERGRWRRQDADFGWHRRIPGYTLQIRFLMSAKPKTKLPEQVNEALARRKGSVSRFIARHYRHFNAAVLIDSAKAYEAHLKAGGKMLVTLAGAMSTAELGISLAEMIRRGKVHGIVCTCLLYTSRCV